LTALAAILLVAQVPGPLVVLANERVVRVRNTIGATTNLGTGTVLGGKGGIAIVLTAGHLFEDATGDLSVVFRNRAVRSGRLVARSKTADLAALEIRDERNLPMLRLAPTQAKSATLLGYGFDGVLRAKTGAVRDRFNGGQFEYSFGATEGDSGGGVFTADGQLTGILWGKSGGATSGPGVLAGVDHLRAFLGSHGTVEQPPTVAYEPLPASYYVPPQIADESVLPPPTLTQAASHGHHHEAK
jgi:S1-C subfamily serine protease